MKLPHSIISVMRNIRNPVLPIHDSFVRNNGRVLRIRKRPLLFFHDLNSYLGGLFDLSRFCSRDKTCALL
ncbi:hypothetical protein X979_5724 [Burkholderia pseudomallei MSHR7527]|nr:hypothetical protein X979_5724 [Burkholderia pseudomallei MSHR7527]